MTNTIYFNITRDDESVSSCSSSRISEVEELPRYHSAFDRALMALKRKIMPSYGAQPPFTKQIGIDEVSNSKEQHADLSSSANLAPQTEGQIFEHFNLKSLSFVELENATISFDPSNVLGNASSTSPVFKGWIDQHRLSATELEMDTEVVVRKLIKGAQSDTEWLAQIKYLGTFNHPNLVKLVGYCLESEHRLLVSEFIPGASLEDHFSRGNSDFLPLTLSIRMKIALEVAKALAFLHEAGSEIIHGSIKPSNILLDMNYNAKLSDIGLINDYQISPPLETIDGEMRVRHMNEYSAPEIVRIGAQTIKSDVYSFGVVLLELLLGQFTLEDAEKVVAEKVIALVTLCLDDNPMCRLTTEQVVKILEKQVEVLKEQFEIKEEASS